MDLSTWAIIVISGALLLLAFSIGYVFGYQRGERDVYRRQKTMKRVMGEDK